MSLIIALIRCIDNVLVYLRAHLARRTLEEGKDLALGNLARKQFEKLQKAVHARRLARNRIDLAERLHDDDGQRRD